MSDALSDRLVGELQSRGAILDGHFKLSSGRHSSRFVQKFRILEDPVLVESLASALADHVRSLHPTVVVSAAVGGIVLGYEVARQLGVLGIFVEKEDGIATLRRGFHLDAGDRAFIVEDVVTTGLSVREVIAVVRGTGAVPVAVGAIVQRSDVDFGIPAFPLLKLPIESFAPDACPQCRAREPVTEPGSRFLTRPS